MNSKARTQHEELKNHVIGVLENIIELIKAEEYDQIIDKKTGYSGPNDYNFYINFAYHEDNAVDIDEILDRLQMLKREN